MTSDPLAYTIELTYRTTFTILTLPKASCAVDNTATKNIIITTQTDTNIQ